MVSNAADMSSTITAVTCFLSILQNISFVILMSDVSVL